MTLANSNKRCSRRCHFPLELRTVDLPVQKKYCSLERGCGVAARELAVELLEHDEQLARVLGFALQVQDGAGRHELRLSREDRWVTQDFTQVTLATRVKGKTAENCPLPALRRASFQVSTNGLRQFFNPA